MYKNDKFPVRARFMLVGKLVRLQQLSALLIGSERTTFMLPTLIASRLGFSETSLAKQSRVRYVFG